MSFWDFLLLGINKSMLNIIYNLVNRTKEKQGIYPCYYIGSKLNYIPGTYWGSSKNPILLKELKENISDFNINILEHVDKEELTTRERFWQLKLNVLQDNKYYNLSLAKEKFTGQGFTWFHDPITLLNGYFPRHKSPDGWQLGKSPETAKRTALKKEKIPTALKKGSSELNKLISIRTKEKVARGKDHKDCKIWVLKDPLGNIHTVIGLHPFCKEKNLSPTALQYSVNTNKPIKKGLSQGWHVLEKK